jgi:hypothetical protein
MSHHILMMGKEIAPETSAVFNQLTRLKSRDFANFSRCETLRSQISLADTEPLGKPRSIHLPLKLWSLGVCVFVSVYPVSFKTIGIINT